MKQRSRPKPDPKPEKTPAPPARLRPLDQLGKDIAGLQSELKKLADRRPPDPRRDSGARR